MGTLAKLSLSIQNDRHEIAHSCEFALNTYQSTNISLLKICNILENLWLINAWICV